jgi:purine-binding chemotaxis protein CheW
MIMKRKTSPASQLLPRNEHAILEERARLLARLPEKDAGAKTSLDLIAFHLGKEHIGVSTSLIYETQILSSLNWSRVPCAPDFIKGAVNLRGHIYSIMDLAPFLGLPAHTLTEKAHILLARGGRCVDGKEMELAFLTDDVPQSLELSIDQLNPVPDTVSKQLQGFLRGVTAQFLMVLDLDRLLSEPRLIVYDT